ncbi:MAG: RNA 2',3'-cyclic phosphodiesterase [Xanthomonadales bacterium]|nr:RNA 2',3'-cyclic phosphodiesterase [Gammaproteobacteria bacterium]NNK51818.1 RNA 2',3'-cyclic phosphodiesterase [Xanthomonadales bacterium]
MSDRHRLFFALVPGRSVRNKIAVFQESLAVSGRAAQPAQFHATLAFLGMQQERQLPLIRQVASGLTFPPCRVTLDHLGRFGRAGVLWLGVRSVPGELMVFQQALVQGLQDAGIGHDPKPWKFHVTLYRKLRKPSPIMPPVAIEWKLNGFDLVESVNVGNGVKYTSIGHW